MPDQRSPEQHLSHFIMERIRKAKVNLQDSHEEYEALIDLIENVRSEKEYEWMSNVSLPEYPSHVLTQAASDAATYFQTRDFVEVYHQDETPEAIAAAKANKELINRTLNQRHIRHYQKYMRAKINNNIYGLAVARCWWEQELKEDIIGYEPTININPMTGEEVQGEREVVGKVPVIDRFNWDVLDPRNVFYDNTYGYSLQDKKWVTIRYEATLDELKADAATHNYINLDKLKKVEPPEKTETARESYDKDADSSPASKNLNYDIYETHGLEWCVEKEDGTTGYGYDKYGEVRKNAVLREMIVTLAVSGNDQIVIRFQKQPYRDYSGKEYRSIIRGLNYIHPSKDGGIGDGTYSRELQVFINDTVNMSNDRVKLATLPTLKGNKLALEDNETVYFAPEHVIEVYNKDDIEEFKIDSDISGAMQQLQLGISMLQRVNATFPTTMGDTPEDASTTATAIAGAEQRTNSRTSYRSLTWEHTFLTELYWMITQMTAQFAHIQTAKRLFGNDELLMAFKPDYEFWYKPVTGAIETEYGKGQKTKENISLIQVVAQSTNPGATRVVNMLMADVLEMRGKDKAQYAHMLLDESQPMSQQNVGNSPEAQGVPVSNQNQVPMSSMEQSARPM